MEIGNVNAKQIAFIICVNNEQYCEQCLKYIQRLEVPDGYDIDIICVREAESMAAGYHAAMQSSPAKYKVYLHQDTFIINRRFIYEILQIFESDNNIGILGVIGVLQLPKDANCYMEWNTGRVLACDGAVTFDNTLYQDECQRPLKVRAIDGVLMVTQYDLAWREDVLNGWDFYDVSQSLEMQRNGYSVVVPYQKEIWCYHDCGASKLKEYNYYRARVMKEYSEYFEGEVDEAKMVNTQEAYRQLEKVREQILYLFEMGLYDELEQIFEKDDFKSLNDTEVREAVNIINIYKQEKKQHGKIVTDIFRKKWKDTQREYRRLKFELLYDLYACKIQKADIVKQKLEQGERISKEALIYIMNVIS